MYRILLGTKLVSQELTSTVTIIYSNLSLKMIFEPVGNCQHILSTVFSDTLCHDVIDVFFGYCTAIIS